jgi:type 1 fimbriae regulatory protein FimB
MLFVGERGDQPSRRAVLYIVRQAATRAKLSAHPHTQDYVGHKNPRHTAHYTRISGRKFLGIFK